jgi:hypothetical protein
MGAGLLVLCAALLPSCVPSVAAARGGVVDRSNAFVGYTEKAGSSSRRDAVAGCRDSSPSCSDWSASGECAKNPGFMLTTCPLSCGSCAPPDGLPEALEGEHEVVTFTTKAGSQTLTFDVALRPDIAPRTAAYVRQMAAAQSCDSSCRFYRAEPIPQAGAIDNFGGPGPPYALVQGSLASPEFSPIEREGAPLVQRGDACLIGTGPDFFVALHGHPEWGNGHTVWGRVLGSSMAGVDAIVQQPLKNETWGETHVSVLVTPLPFTLRLRSR